MIEIGMLPCIALDGAMRADCTGILVVFLTSIAHNIKSQRTRQ